MREVDNPPFETAAVAKKAWAKLVAREPYYAAKAGIVVEKIPSRSYEEQERVAEEARELLGRISRVDQTALCRTDRLTLGVLAHMAKDDVATPDRWLTEFGVTPYAMGGLMSVAVPTILNAAPLETVEDRERYVSLVRDVAGLVETLAERTRVQASRGWRVPRPALDAVRLTVSRLAAAAPSFLMPDRARLDDEIVRGQITRVTESDVAGAFSRLLDELGAQYEQRAPTVVGQGTYPGGEAAYRRSVNFHLSYDADPEELHRVGVAEVAKLSDEMAAVRSRDFGWDGDEGEFHARLREDAKAKAASPEALEETYKRHLARMEPIFGSLVRLKPKSTPQIRRLAPALEAGMTFGYYEPSPTPGGPGTYFFSANGIEHRLQISAAPIIFHELVPGHHVHISRQAENDRLPDIRRLTIAFSAFNEGWAEYSAGLADEAGLYDDRYDKYGWLVHQRFVSQRLVVDTGLNLLGWSLDQARAYMAQHTLEADAQIASETLRYATDLPGQALAYRAGFLKFRALRERARSQLKSSFDLSAFHEAILSEGALPLGLLDQSLADWALEQRGAHAHS